MASSILVFIMFLQCETNFTNKFLGSHLGRIYRVSVTNCTQTPCIFHIGQNYTIEVDASSRKFTLLLITYVPEQ